MAKDIITRLKSDTSNFDKGINSAIGKLKSFQQQNLSLGGLLNKGTVALTGYAGAFLSVGAAIKGNIETAKNFQTSISKLSSITGMAGEDLNKLKQYAIDLGGSTTQSASQVAEAFMLIGSQKPELLKNQEALRDTTKAAITLGEAASIDVTEAARALTASLNIMGESADQANRYINVLAAGSKEGAVDINGLTEIVFKSGQAAKMNKMSFEELIAVAESIGPSFGSAAEAGTALNAMLLKLETQTNNNFKPSVVGLDTALKNLKEANLSAAETAKMVTETGMKALVPLLQNVNGVNDLKEAITGTNTAEEQSKTNTNNLSGSLASLDSAWEKFNLTLNDSNGGLKTLVDWLASAVNWMAEMAKHTTIAEQAVRKFNEANGYTEGSETDYQKLETRQEQMDAWSNRKNTMRNEILAKQSRLAHFNSRLQGTDADNAIKPIIATLEKQIAGLKEAEAAYIKGGLDFFAGGGKSGSSATALPTTTTTKGSKKTFGIGMSGLDSMSSGLAFGGTESMKELNAQLAMYKKNLLEAKDATAQLAAQRGIEETQKAIAAQPVALSLGVSTDEIVPIQEKINNFFKDNPIQLIDEETLRQQFQPGLMNPVINDTEKAQEAFTQAANAVASMGGALSSLEDPGAKVAGMVAQAIASIALTFAASMKGTFTPWDWIAGAAAGTATMIATIASIKSATKGYADGGLVSGGAFTGDAVPILANQGEIVLSAAMQRNLASNLQSNASGGGGRSTISGEQIVTVVNAYGRRTGRGEILR